MYHRGTASTTTPEPPPLLLTQVLERGWWKDDAGGGGVGGKKWEEVVERKVDKKPGPFNFFRSVPQQPLLPPRYTHTHTHTHTFCDTLLFDFCRRIYLVGRCFFCFFLFWGDFFCWGFVVVVFCSFDLRFFFWFFLLHGRFGKGRRVGLGDGVVERHCERQCVLSNGRGGGRGRGVKTMTKNETRHKPSRLYTKQEGGEEVVGRSQWRVWRSVKQEQLNWRQGGWGEMCCQRTSDGPSKCFACCCFSFVCCREGFLFKVSNTAEALYRSRVARGGEERWWCDGR